jgi:hypothetical protein
VADPPLLGYDLDQELEQMSVVVALRRLRRRRRLVVLTLIVACAVGVAITRNIPSLTSRQHRVGIASASALVDSSRSQVADLGDSSGTDVVTLAGRASLLASLMTSSPIKDTIAARAGINPADLIAEGPATVTGTGSPGPSVPDAPISMSNPKASLLDATVPTLAAGQIPVIQVNTQAPTAAIAANLADAAFTALQTEIRSLAATDRIPTLEQVVIRPLGLANAAESSQGPGPLLGIVAAIVAFLLGCGAILGIASVGEALRAESAQEQALLLQEAGAADTFTEDELPTEVWDVSHPIQPDTEAPLVDDGAQDPHIADVEPAFHDRPPAKERKRGRRLLSRDSVRGRETDTGARDGHRIPS